MTPQLSRSVTGGGRTRVVSLHGELDIATGTGLLDWLLENAGSMLVIDLDGVSFMDSSGIRVIVQAKNRLGDSLVLTRPRRNVRLVFEVTGLDNWFSDWDPAWSPVPESEPPGPFGPSSAEK